MAEARIPGPPQCLIFRSQPEPARPRERCEQASAVAKVPVLPRQSPVAAALRIRTRRALLLLAASAFFVAWVSPLFVPTSISPPISSSWFLVSAWGCGVASLSALEISLVSEWTPSVPRFPRIDRDLFLR